ncbi:MAG: ADOP family duplicated permease [Gemmatimonadaceae bacterium]
MSFLDDVRIAARALARRPGFLFVTTLTLGVGIAANAVMFGVVDQLLLQPPPHVADADGLRRVYYDWGGVREPTPAGAYPMVTALRRNVPAAEVAGLLGVDEFTLGSGADARAIQVQMVTGNFFQLLGVPPTLGRTFVPGDDRAPQGERVAVVSDGFWRREMGQALDVLGRVLMINGETFQVIGVTPRGFSGVDRERVDAWVPVSSMAAQQYGARWHDTPNWYGIRAIARIRAGASAGVAAEQATVAVRNEIATWDRPVDESPPRVVLASIIGARHPSGVSGEGKVSIWLLGVSAIVLLIACANVANLLLARTLERRTEIAVRMALGIGRGRLARMLFVEASLLALTGAAFAIGLSLAAARFVQSVLMPGIVWNDTVLDARVFGVTLLAATACILLAGMAPALQGLATPVVQGLKASSAQTAGSRGHVRHALLALQAALSVVLLVGAGLFIQSLQKVVSRDVGVDLDHALLVTADLQRAGFSRPQVEDVYRTTQERLRGTPGIVSAAIVRQTIPTMRGSGMSIMPQGVSERSRQWPSAYYSVVPSDYFATIGTTIIRGRPFTESEERVPSRVMIVNKLLADGYWPGQDPIGQCARLGSDSVCTAVVGVVGNAMLFRMVQDDRALLYIPPSHPAFGNRPPAGVVARAHGDPTALIGTIRREIQSIVPNMPFVRVEAFSERVAEQLRPWRLGSTMFIVFGGVALLIAAIGLYSVMAYTVSQRTREIGVRMALGAQAGNVVRLIVGESGATIAAGLAAGLLIAFWGGRWIAPMLYETSPRDPLVFIVASGVLAAAAIVASIVPARRTTRVDPAIALRAE